MQRIRLRGGGRGEGFILTAQAMEIKKRRMRGA